LVCPITALDNSGLGLWLGVMQYNELYIQGMQCDVVIRQTDV